MDSEYRVYEIIKDEYCYMSREEAKKFIFDGEFPRMLSEEEQKDISYLVEDRFIDFFTDPKSDFEERNDGIMYEFRMKVLKAYKATYGFGRIKCETHMWRQMLDKYCNTDKMLNCLYELSNIEIIVFLEHCIWREGRFNYRAYTDWSKEGVIGKILLRLKELPLVLDV